MTSEITERNKLLADAFGECWHEWEEPGGDFMVWLYEKGRVHVFMGGRCLTGATFYEIHLILTDLIKLCDSYLKWGGSQ